MIEGRPPGWNDREGPHQAAPRPPSVKARALDWVDHLLSFGIRPGSTLVVSGFWRSGTTWLLQSLAGLLRAKTVFEPFNVNVPGVAQIYPDAVAGAPWEMRALFMPYCGAESLDGHPLRAYLERALRADLPGFVVRRARSKASEGLRRRAVVKLVQGSLCLRAAQATFGVPAIHLCRDPRAVVASMKRGGWEWMFEPGFLRRQLLEVPDGRAEAFAAWGDEIARYDRQEAVARIAAYWALTERYVRDRFDSAGEAARIVFLGFEELCRAPQRAPSSALERLGLRPADPARLGAVGDSPTTTEERLGISPGERTSGWRDELTAAEIERVESVAQRFGLEDRMVDPEPLEVPTR